MCAGPHGATCRARARALQCSYAILVYSLASAVGQNFIYYTVTQFNPLVLTTVSARRPSHRTHFTARAARAGAVPPHPLARGRASRARAARAPPTALRAPRARGTQVTTTRKIFTTVYSVFRNPANRLALGQWGGCGLVFVGLLIDIAVQAICPKKAKAPAPPPPDDETEMEIRRANDADEELGSETERQQQGLLAK